MRDGVTDCRLKSPEVKSNHGGQLVFGLVFVLFTVFLLLTLTSETRFTAGKQLFAQPRFWPGAAVLGMFVFGLGHLYGQRKRNNHNTGAELLSWIKALEYFVWFMVYVFAVPVAGYLPTTLLFMFLLALRLGYRSGKSLMLALLIGFTVVLVFKTGLSVRIPGGAVYEQFPSAMRNFMITYF